MSQAGIINVIENNPTIPIYFEGDTGFSVALFNVIRIVGVGGITTSASGNTITIDGSGITPPDLTITGNTGGPLSPIGDNWNIVTTNSTPIFEGVGSTLTLDFALTNNLLLGSSGSITTGQNNVAIGALSQSLNQSGNSNVSVGYGALQNTISGGGNVAIGLLSLRDSKNNGNVGIGFHSLILCTTGQNNTAIGFNSAPSITLGSENIFIGNTSGGGYLTTESSNIIINNVGTLGESNTIRIGTQGSGSGQQNRAFMAGINGVTVSNAVPVTIDSTTGQLGVGTPVTQGIVTINGDSGSITGSTVTIYSNNASLGSGSTVLFENSGTTSTFKVTDALNNVIIGAGAGTASITGANNSGQGYLTLATLSSGDSNCCLGSTSLTNLQSGSNNVAMGVISLQNLTTGDNNVGIGRAAGQAYTTNESNNICIGSSVTGTIGENNVIRIGNSSGQCFISGINGSTVTGTSVICATDGQLGTIVSSKRYKENIHEITEDVSILDLVPVKFNYKSDKSKALNYGLIAEDVEKDFPYLCFYKDGLAESVKYHELPTFLLLEIQRLVKRIEILEAIS